MKKKRKLNGKFLGMLGICILICLSIYKVPHFINTNKLLDLGYSSMAIDSIYDKGLRSNILKNEYYSDYLNEEITKDTFNKNYLRLYVLCDELNEDYFNLYEKLKEKKNYNDDELEQLYASLKIYDLKPLLIFDKLESIDDYIKDCLAHNNSDSKFEVSGDYLHMYENVVETNDPSNIEVFVSSKNSLGTYAPVKLAKINSTNAIDGVYLETRALEAYYNMCTDLRNEDLSSSFYAIGGYISYEDQKELYMQSNNRIKEGFADTQTGLGVYLANEEGVSFENSKSYKWLSEHAHEYGFIQRYPKGKECLTGHSPVYNYYRFVGIELATNIHDSGLCFDEYYYYN